ncbi:MAG: hypothetical protein AAGK74_13665, partial [Chloroflexota bacterium]
QQSAERILQTELEHQYHVLENGRVNLFWIIGALVLLIPALLIAVVGVVVALVIAVSPTSVNAIVAFLTGQGWVRNLVVHMVGMGIATDLVVGLVSLSLAANAITREYRGATWPLLLMTGVSARHMVLGKWWASVLVLRRDFISVAILRVGLVCAAFVILPIIMVRVGFVSNVWLLLLAIGLSLVYSVLDAQVIAAIAILGALAVERDGSGLAVSLRMAVILIGWAVAGAVIALMWENLSLAFVVIPAALVVVWIGLLAVGLWALLWVGVRARILPRHTT